MRRPQIARVRIATGTRLLVLFALVAAVLTVSTLSAEAVTRPATLYQERPVSTGVVEPGFPIDHVGVVFDLPPGEDVHHDHDGDDHAGTGELAVRFRTDGIWGPWQHVTEDGAQEVGQFTGALVDGGDADAYQVRGVPAFAENARAAALNTTDGPEQVIGHRPAASADAVTTCKSRFDWGADETIRTSNRSYADMQVMTVHHTATQNDDPDPEARVRAIYEYHVKTNGWDDIGYQALISEDGTVYEGRWSGSDSSSCAESAGGNGWDFGHYGTEADAHMVTGAHTGGYNTGNFGVALLGDFRTVAPKAAARDALVEYLAELAERHGIDPTVKVLYDNGTNSKEVYTISGHQDFSSTACPGAVLYDDLPNLRSDTAAAMGNSAPAVTITSPSSQDTYKVEEPTEGAGATLTFAAEATDESTALAWEWTDSSGAVLATAASFDTTLAVGTYTFTAAATDSESLTGTDQIVVEVTAHGTASTVDDVATGETAVTGTVSGTYRDTAVADGVAETIAEVESGGRPATRYSSLEHIWTVPVTGGSSVTLFVDATATSSGDSDDFEFAYSLDGGSTYSPALTFPAGAVGTYSAPLPASTSGEVRIRVRDGDRTAGANALDSISVDHLYIRSESATSASAPLAPDPVNASATSATTIDVTWQDVEDEWGFELERGTDSDGDGVVEWAALEKVAAGVTNHTDTGLAGSTAYTYRVRAYNGAGASDWAVSAAETTPAVAAITLAAEGYKVKGQHHVKLTWSGATNVRVYRDGVRVADVTGSEYIDEALGSGKGTYTHKVCALDGDGVETGTCSDETTTTFS